MLVLSAKPEDGVQIGEHVRITVIDVRPRNVRIGIEAPKSIAIRRDPASTRSGPASNRAAGRSAEDRCAGKAEPSANAQRACDPATADQTPMAVMVVSRDQPLIDRLRRVLDHEQGVEAVTVGSITESKRRIAQQQAIDPQTHPDVVLLDADLSPQTAILFLHWLRQSDSRRVIPVVVLRGESTPHSNATLLAAGANVTVRKDQSAGRVEQCIRAAIDMWRHAEPRRTERDRSWQEAVA